MRPSNLVGIFFFGIAVLGLAYEQGKIDEQNKIKGLELQKKNKKNKKNKK